MGRAAKDCHCKRSSGEVDLKGSVVCEASNLASFRLSLAQRLLDWPAKSSHRRVPNWQVTHHIRGRGGRRNNECSAKRRESHQTKERSNERLHHRTRRRTPDPPHREVDLRVGGEGKYKESLFLQSFLPRNSYCIHRVLVSYLCITGRRPRVRLHGQGWTVRVYFPLAPLWNLVWNLGLVSSPVPFPDGPLFAGFVCIPS